MPNIITFRVYIYCLFFCVKSTLFYHCLFFFIHNLLIRLFCKGPRNFSCKYSKTIKNTGTTKSKAKVNKHTSHNSCSQRTITICSCTRREHQRKHTEYHTKYRHDNRSETCLSCRISRGNNSHTFTSTFYSVLGNQNSRLRQQANQHNRSCLQINIVFQSGNTSKKETTH